MWRPRDLSATLRCGRWTSTTIEGLPRLPGTYAIYRRDPTTVRLGSDNTSKQGPIELGPPKLVYIGSANNIRARLTDYGLNSRHPRRVCHFGQVDRLSIKVAPDRWTLQHLSREARLLNRLRPPLNRVTHRTHK